jgi:hypothetical protein
MTVFPLGKSLYETTVDDTEQDDHSPEKISIRVTNDLSPSCRFTLFSRYAKITAV